MRSFFSRHHVTGLALAVAAASGLWFVARDARPVLPFAELKAMLLPQESVFPMAMAATPPKPIPEADFVGQMAMAGFKAHRLSIVTVKLCWRKKDPYLIMDGKRYPLIGVQHRGEEVAFLVPDLYGRKGDWRFRLRIRSGALAGTLTPPDDGLMGGYLVVNQAVTRKVIPPPPAVPKNYRKR